ncbi:hypothetical protein N7478_008751 [Penicillium angulare]|uniref:uncharacterized protein n=1 Tax=Penicillium angulare TaxID=116970 RepID=UPI0025417FDB|nr:uncharacterized protein N7478_008751 [Penicillium angulare]KAJ5273626.1 hypothetical protein N7478_008751 [Penicillium angulare]
MDTRNRSSQPAQPPKQAAYAQSSNPVSHTLGEQRESTAPIRHHGDPPMIKRTAHSKPSSDEARARLDERHRLEQKQMQNALDVDLEYGVEQQPSEGYIADSVKRKGMGLYGAQAGAHAGSVGSSHGPGHPGFGEERDLAADMDRKMVEHERFLGDEIGRSPPEPEYDVAEREAVRQNKLQRDKELDVEEAVKDATGNSVVSHK